MPRETHGGLQLDTTDIIYPNETGEYLPVLLLQAYTTRPTLLCLISMNFWKSLIYALYSYKGEMWGIKTTHKLPALTFS